MKKNYRLLISFMGFASVFISSCELYNPAEKIPAYIHIQKIDLTTDYATEGSNSSKITDAWVYIGDQLIGCFELPATFPVLAEGIQQVKIRAGIKVNGISSNRSPYPFYTIFEQQIDLQKGKTITLSPSVSYLSTANFTFMQDFEAVGVTIEPTSNSDSILEITASPDPNVFEGSKSGAIYSEPGRPFVEVATVNPYSLPKGGAPVFLEFNYKCNYEFTVSIIAYGSATSAQFPVLHFNPSENWNKTYTYLTPSVSSANSAINYKIVWGMLNNSGADSIALLLDNIKLIY